MRKNKKLVEITPEWILGSLSESTGADGYGNMCICANSLSDGNWILMALNTLKIQFEVNKNAEFEDILFSFEFKIEAIKFDCPTLYDAMKKLNIKNLEYNIINGMGLN